MKRDIMVKDNLEYQEACKIFEKIEAENSSISFSFPNKLGLISSCFAAFVSIPMIFHYPTVHWFNEKFVTTDVPEPKDLETFLEVGSWAWQWIEPLQGSPSFFLICFAFSKAHFNTLGITPLSEAMQEKRASLMIKKFPMYEAETIKMYCKSQ